MKALIAPDSANQVNEEELFAGLIYERIKSSKGEEVAKQYTEALETEKAARQKPDGYIPYEYHAKAA